MRLQKKVWYDRLLDYNENKNKRYKTVIQFNKRSNQCKDQNSGNKMTIFLIFDWNCPESLQQQQQQNNNNIYCECW